jgi:tetratricopeptide (TPR) repeat protein
VLLTPRWIGSEFCRKEYRTFEEVEPSLGNGEYVAPFLVRPLATQEPHFTDEQRNVWTCLRDRQFKPVNAVDFLKLDEDERTALIDQLADEIESMLDRRRQKLVSDKAAGATGSPQPVEIAAIQRELSQANRDAELRHQQLLSAISAEKGVPREKLEPILAALGYENVPLEEMPQRLREAVDALRAKAAEPVRASNEGIEVDQAIRDARAELRNLNTEAAIAVLDKAIEADEAFKAAAQRRATLLVEKADIQRRSFDHSGAIANLEEAVRLDRDRVWAWIALGDARRIVDSLASARAAFGSALDAVPEAGSERDESVVLNRIGDVLLAEGDRPGALEAYRKSLAIAEALAAKDPGNTQWQRDLSIIRDGIDRLLPTEDG